MFQTSQRSLFHVNDVIPAKAGIHISTRALSAIWIPAFAGMTPQYQSLTAVGLGFLPGLAARSVA
jgi:hypothetical protein